MHDYAVFGHDRVSIGRWLGVVSLGLTGGITQALSFANELTGVEAFTKVTITTALIYFLLHWLFNKYIWKNNTSNISDLSGTWLIEGKTLEEDGSIKYEWDAKIGIEQTWEKIAIHLQNDTSQSFSYTATIEKINGLGGWLLSYSYGNEPYLERQHELKQHKGYCQIQFDKELKTATANYFNREGRNTYGVMKLTKEAL